MCLPKSLQYEIKCFITIKWVYSLFSFSITSAWCCKPGTQGKEACWTCHNNRLSDIIISGETLRRKSWLQFYFTSPKTAEIICFRCTTTTTHSFPATNFGCHRNPVWSSALKLNSGTQWWLFITSKYQQYYFILFFDAPLKTNFHFWTCSKRFTNYYNWKGYCYLPF